MRFVSFHLTIIMHYNSNDNGDFHDVKRHNEIVVNDNTHSDKNIPLCNYFHPIDFIVT